MPGIGPKLPLVKDANDGFAVTQTMKENIKQSLKMLVLTNPGERVMLPEYGVGLRTFLFENDVPITRSRIVTKIQEQVSEYMPYVQINDIIIDEDPNLKDGNILHIRIKYFAAGVGSGEELDLYLESLSSY